MYVEVPSGAARNTFSLRSGSKSLPLNPLLPGGLATGGESQMVTESRELWQLLGQKPEKEGTFQKTSRKQPPAGRGYEQRNFHGEGPAVASFSARGLNGEGEDVPGPRGSLREGTGQGAQASGPSGISSGTPGQAGLGQGEVLTVGSPSPSPLGNGPGRLEPPSWNPASTLAPQECPASF